MDNHDSFAPVLLQRVGLSLLLYIVLCLPSFVGTLYSGFGILSWEQYYDIMGSSLMQNVYYSELYIRLGVGWLPFLVLLSLILSSIIISHKEGGGDPEPGAKTVLTLQLFVANVVTMAILAPIAFVGLLNNIGIVDDSATFRFLNSDFIIGIYNNDYSWAYVVFPFLIASPIILSVCAHAWYQPTSKAIVPTPAPASLPEAHAAPTTDQLRPWDV